MLTVHKRMKDVVAEIEQGLSGIGAQYSIKHDKNRVEMWGTYEYRENKEKLNYFIFKAIFGNGELIKGSGLMYEILVRENGGFNILVSNNKNDYIKGVNRVYCLYKEVHFDKLWKLF